MSAKRKDKKTKREEGRKIKETENNCSEKENTVQSDKDIFDPSDSKENILVFPI